MKLADYAKQMGVRYETAWRWFRAGKIQGRRIGAHTIIITQGQEESSAAPAQCVAIYARASSAEKKGTLDSQAERLVAYCAARGYQVRWSRRWDPAATTRAHSSWRYLPIKALP